MTTRAPSKARKVSDVITSITQNVNSKVKDAKNKASDKYRERVLDFVDDVALEIKFATETVTRPARAIIMNHVHSSPVFAEAGYTKKNRLDHFPSLKSAFKARKDYKKYGVTEDELWSLDYTIFLNLYARLQLFKERVLEADETVTVPVFDTVHTINGRSGTLHEWTDWMLEDCKFIADKMFYANTIEEENEAYDKLSHLWVIWSHLNTQYVW